DQWLAIKQQLSFLRPRWGGSHEAMEAFGAARLGRARFDTMEPLVYLEAVSSIVEDQQDLAWLARPGVRDRLDALSRGYADVDQSPWRSWIDTWRFLAALAAEDHAAALAIAQTDGFALEQESLGKLRRAGNA